MDNEHPLSARIVRPDDLDSMLLSETPEQRCMGRFLATDALKTIFDWSTAEIHRDTSVPIILAALMNGSAGAVATLVLNFVRPDADLDKIADQLIAAFTDAIHASVNGDMQREYVIRSAAERRKRMNSAEDFMQWLEEIIAEDPAEDTDEVQS